jgi:hypothetical protein
MLWDSDKYIGKIVALMKEREMYDNSVSINGKLNRCAKTYLLHMDMVGRLSCTLPTMVGQFKASTGHCVARSTQTGRVACGLRRSSAAASFLRSCRAPQATSTATSSIG